MDMENLSREKKYILGMSDDQLRLLISAAARGIEQRRTEIMMRSAPRANWFGQRIGGLSPEAQTHLKEVTDPVSIARNPAAQDRKWVRYAQKFNELYLETPPNFSMSSRPKQAYQQLARFFTEHHLPEEIIPFVIPTLISYMETGHMRPMILVGEKGCGKTTCAELLLKEALSIPVEVIKVPETSYGHGLTGDSGTYRSADLGSLAKAQLKNNSLLVGYIIDEIDKVPDDSTHSTIDEELLSITDNSVSTVEDKYLESRLYGLPYCPICFTANDLDRINPILADRCSIVRYPNPTPERLKSILAAYAEKRLSETSYAFIDFDYPMMNRFVDRLLSSNVFSIRKHQKMVEIVLNQAFDAAMHDPSDGKTPVTEAMFLSASNEVAGTEQRRMGF